MPKSLHIVFGPSARKTLSLSNYLDAESTKLYNLDDDLSIGPIFNEFTEKNIPIREKWLDDKFASTDYHRVIVETVKRDIKLIEKINHTIKNYHSIFLWTGLRANEIISTARFIYLLNSLSTDISILNLKGVTLTSLVGKTFNPETLGVVNPDQVSLVAEHFEKIGSDEVESWKKRWESFSSNPANLRVVDKSDEIQYLPEDHYDPILESNCTNEFQKSARVIGETLCETDFHVSDHYFNWRLKELAKNNKLTYKGDLKDMRDYEVKINSGS